MKITYRILMSFLLLAAVTGLACNSPQLVLEKNKSRFAPLPSDTSVYFYFRDKEIGLTNGVDPEKAKVLYMVYKSGKQIAGITSYYYFYKAREINNGILKDKDYKAIIKQTYADVWKDIVPDISFIYIYTNGKNLDQLEDIRCYNAGKGEMKYPADTKFPLGWTTVHMDDIPKIAAEALKRGANVVSLDHRENFYKLDSNGKRVQRKVVTEKKSESVYTSNPNELKYKITEKYYYEDIYTGCSTHFSFMRINELLPGGK